jgi:hypothetical protein
VACAPLNRRLLQSLLTKDSEFVNLRATAECESSTEFDGKVLPLRQHSGESLKYRVESTWCMPFPSCSLIPSRENRKRYSCLLHVFPVPIASVILCYYLSRYYFRIILHPWMLARQTYQDFFCRLYVLYFAFLKCIL